MGLPAVVDPIVQSGPLTVAYPDVARLLVTLSQARELAVLQQGQQPVRIQDLAGQTTQLRGRDDIEFVFTGLRDGEQLHEDLFGAAEGQPSTSHEMIDAMPVPVPVPALGIVEVRESGMQWAEAQGAA